MSTEIAHSPAPLDRQRRNCRWLQTFFLILLFFLLLAIGWVQIWQSENLSQRSLRQQIRKVYVPAKRGIIADRNGHPLNYTIPSYTLVMRPDLLRDPRDSRRRTLEKVSLAISELALSLGPDFYHFKPSLENIRRHLEQRTPLPIPLWEDLQPETIARWALQRQNFPASELLLSWKRCYAEPECAAQLRGFTRPGQLDDPDLKQYWNANFQEPIGISGLELALNFRLRGSGGSEVLQTDVLAFRNTILESHPAVNGEDLRLTLDWPLQRLAEKLFAEHNYAGAAVLLDARNGDVLVLASAPTYNLNHPEASSQNSAQFNRAVGGVYPPGSIIKPFLALLALQEGLVTAEEKIFCPGHFSLQEGLQIGCSSRLGHSDLDLISALAKSCNTYFCVLGQRLGGAGWEKMLDTYGLGRKLNTLLYRQETAGVGYAPSVLPSQRPSDQRWHAADSAYAGIGQGLWLVSPLQMAVYSCALLTGSAWQPRFLLDAPVELLESYSWSEENLRIIRQGLSDCVHTPGGTGRALALVGPSVLGKTGTAEVSGKPPHAWCIGALPADHPRLVGVCLVEHGGGGGRIAAPILAQLLALAQERLR